MTLEGLKCRVCQKRVGLVDAGVVHPPHRHVESGFVTIPVCKLKEGNGGNEND